MEQYEGDSKATLSHEEPTEGPVRALRFFTSGGGEVQVNVRNAGEPRSAQDQYWDDVAFESAGGFHYPNANFDQSYYDEMMKRFSKRKPDDGFGEEFVAGVQDVMREISNDLEEARVKRHAPRSSLARAVGWLGVRRGRGRKHPN